MSMDLTGITNQNEYYTNHYFSSIFEENASDTISRWRAEAKESDTVRTPWALLREAARQYYPVHDRFLRSKFDTQTLANIRTLADIYLSALGYPAASPEWVELDEVTRVPVYLELNKPNGAPALWVLLATSDDKEAAILDKFCFSASDIGEEGLNSVSASMLTSIPNEDLVTKILFGQAEPPRFVLLIGMNQIALIDRNKWNEKRYLQFELEEIFSRHEETTLQAMAVLLHRSSLCPEEGTALLDELDANSQKHAAGVSQDLKFALREAIELLGNEVLYDLAHRQGRDLNAEPVDAGQLTLECLRYMYRMLFVLFIEARPELGYAPIKAQSYLTGYSLESLRDIADAIETAFAPDKSRFYATFIPALEALVETYETFKESYINELGHLREWAEKRRNCIHEELPFSYAEPSFDIMEVFNKYKELQEKTNAYGKEIGAAKAYAQKILRYVEVERFLNEIDYPSQISTLAMLEKQKDNKKQVYDKIVEEISALEKNIEAKYRLLNDEEKGAQKVNEYLSTYFKHR